MNPRVTEFYKKMNSNGIKNRADSQYWIYEINSEINKILMGNKTLEEVLDKYEITPEKGASLVKKKIKTLK